ncbi:MAG: IS110 family transposase [Clostridium sp.]|nr:IS110 family transposase [Clostridium sp.]
MNDNKKMFLGIDIGKEINWVSFLSEGKKEEIRKRLKISNDIYGFYKLLEVLEDYQVSEGITFDEVLIGIESTGHYWQNLYTFFNKRNLDVVMVKNRLVKLKREAKYSQRGKNDSIDCHCIGLVLKDEDYFKIRETDKNYASLKRLTRCKEDYTKNSTQNKNRLRAWLDVNNPIYLKVFKKITCKTGLAILRLYPSPRDIIDKDINELKEELKRDERNKRIVCRDVNEYLLLAKELYKDTIEINIGDREEIKIYLNQYESLETSLKEIKKSIKKLAKETIAVYDKVTEIKGCGDEEIVSLLSEIGCVENFPSARLLQGYLGLGVRNEVSGKEVKPAKITKAGSKRSRKMLYHIAMNLVSKNSEWRKVYCYYKSYNRNNPNTKKEMLIAVACKFLRVLYGMMKYKESFDRDKLLKSFDFRQCNKEKFITEYLGDKGRWKITEEELKELFG